MADSSSFSSLMALVDSHLSKTGVSESRSDYIPSLGPQLGTLSDTRLSFTPNQRLPIPTPSFNLSESPIQSILAEQVGNMLKARELKKKQEEEKQRLAEELNRLKIEDEDDCVIDLMQALQDPCRPAPPVKEEVLSSSSSLESLFEAKFIDCDEISLPSPEPLLPCNTDMSYIVHKKIKKGKCSPFGKVLCARWRPYAPPYQPEVIASKIVRFNFNTPSPCDLIKEKQRKPTTCTQYQPDILNFI